MQQSKVKKRKVNKSKENKKKNGTKKFVPPSLKEIQLFIAENNLNLDAEKFFNHYESNGWMVGSNPMQDWHAAARKATSWASRLGASPTAHDKPRRYDSRLPEFLKDESPEHIGVWFAGQPKTYRDKILNSLPSEGHTPFGGWIELSEVRK